MRPRRAFARSYLVIFCCLAVSACGDPPTGAAPDVAVVDAAPDVVAPDGAADALIGSADDGAPPRPDVAPADRGDPTADAVMADTQATDAATLDATVADGGADGSAPDAGSPDATPDVGSDVGDGGDGGGRTFADGGAPSREFLALYDDIFGPRCGACHGARAGASTNLHMPDPATAYVNLVNRPVRCVVSGGSREGQLRVAPGDPDASVLPAPYEVCGMRHTGTAQMIAYPDEVMRVRAWIADGAR